MERGRAGLTQQSQQYSQLPFPSLDVARHKKQLSDCINEKCFDEELADAYETLGLSQLYLGNYLEAASNLDCACLAQKRSISIDEGSDHSLRLKLWVCASN